METGKALEIVHGMATRLYKRYGELGPAGNPAEAQDALDTIEDLIVNNFEDDAEDAPNAEAETSARSDDSSPASCSVPTRPCPGCGRELLAIDGRIGQCIYCGYTEPNATLHAPTESAKRGKEVA